MNTGREINEIVDYLKEGIPDFFPNECPTEESSGSAEDDEQSSTPDSCETQPLDNQATTCERNIPLNHEEWLVYDPSLGRHRPPHLLEFLHLLLGKVHYRSYASYIDQSAGIFKIYHPDLVATLWEQVKARQAQKAMDYDKFARGIRWHYKKGTMIKTNTRHTFQFAPASANLDENNNYDE